MSGKNPEKILLVYGNPYDGFRYRGPFEDYEMACDFAESHCDADWWTVGMIPPEKVCKDRYKENDWIRGKKKPSPWYKIA